MRRLADGRFLGQGFDLVVALPDGPYDDAEATRARGSRPPSRPPTARSSRSRRPTSPSSSSTSASRCGRPSSGSDVAVPGAAGRRRRRRDQGHAPRVLPRGGRLRVDRRCTTAHAWPPATTLAGPAVVEEEGSTLVVGPGAAARVAPERQPRRDAPARDRHEHAARRHHARGAVDADHLGRRRGGQGHRAHVVLDARPTRPTTSPACSPTRAGDALAQNTRQHPVVHRHPARHGAPLPARDGRRTACGPATCSSPTTRGWAPAT